MFKKLRLFEKIAVIYLLITCIIAVVLTVLTIIHTILN